jgi:ABC-type multidrug transport system ATPase subunit
MAERDSELADLPPKASMAVPSDHKESDTNVEIVFRDLNYSVFLTEKSKEGSPFSRKKIVKEKPILKQISGLFRPGRLTAVMGASGAGKTSLLTLIAGEVNKGAVSGEVLLNGERVIGKAIKKISGFVFQDDLILPTMTVREAIAMSATLRLPSSISPEEKMKKVDDLIKTLNLTKCQHTVIGNAQIKGISGGERKRTAMAMELITDPGVLFLDEPTSGLDT